MNKKLRELREQLKTKAEELKTLCEKDDYTAEDDAVATELKAEMETLKAEIEQLASRDANRELASTYHQFLAANLPAEGAQVPSPATATGEGATATAPVARLHAVPSTPLRNIRGDKFGLSAHQRAYNFGMWALAAYNGNTKAEQYCQQLGVTVRSHMEGDNTKGGWLVPTELSTDILDVRALHSTFRQFARVVPMTSDHKEFRQRKGGLEAFPIGEGKQFSKSELDFGNVSLTAKKWGVLADNSSELSEDAFVSWADEMTGEIARAFARKETECGFYGDGTSQYHGITGLIPALRALNSDVAKIAALQVASGNEWGEITLADFIGVTSRIGSLYANSPKRWYCSQQFYTNVMVNLAMAAGGNAAAEIVNGVARNSFLGYEVVIVEGFPTAQANSQIPVLFGALDQAVMFGDRTGIAIAMSEHVEFENDMLVWRGRERFDINCWNLGNAADAIADLEYGPVAGLITAAS